MKTEQLNNLLSGVTIENIRNGEKFLVEDTNSVTKKILVMNVDTKEEKNIAFATVRRNYDVVDEKSTKQNKVENEVVTQAQQRNIRKPKETEKSDSRPVKSSVPSSAIHENLKLLEEGIKQRFPNSKRHVTGQYIAYRQKQNFIEIYEGKRKLYIMIRTKRLSDEQKEMLDHVYPQKHGWSQDGKLFILDESDVKKSFEFIELSYADSEGLSNANTNKEDNEEKENTQN